MRTPGQPRLYLVPGAGFQHSDSQNRLLDNRDSTLFPGTGFQRIDFWTTETLPCFLALVFNTSTPGQPRLYLVPGTGFQHIDFQNRLLDNRDSTFSWHWFSTHRLLDNRDSTLSLALVFNTSTPGQPRLYLCFLALVFNIGLSSTPGQPRLYLVPGTGFQHIDSWTTETLPCFLALVFNTSTLRIDSWTTETLPLSWHWFSTHQLSE